MNYYNKTWNEEDQHGTTFFKHVDFNKPEYKYQEQVFRDYIKGLKNINSVLELGAGTGRMTKIMLEELPDITDYTCIDVNIQKELLDIDFPNIKSNLTEFDITSKNFGLYIEGKKYDLILASEVFMHIKPQDIENVIKKLSKIGKQIINIDWSFNPLESDWCFIHPYHILYKTNGASEVNVLFLRDINQVLFHYRFDK